MFISTDNALLFTVDFGPGPRALLAIGGWAGSWELWAGPFGRLSRHWRVIGYDHRGTGATVAPLESITLENMVNDVLTVMDTLQVEQCVLAAESAGATVAVLAALKHPERFSGLVIVDGVIHHPPDEQSNPFLQAVRTDFEGTIQTFAYLCAPQPDQAAIRHWGVQILRRSGQAAAARLLECVAGVDLRADAVRIELPTLILHGAEDAIAPVEESRQLADMLANSRLIIIPGAGHVPTMTHASMVADQVDTFFSEQLS